MVNAVADILLAHIDGRTEPRRVVLPGRVVVRTSARIPQQWSNEAPLDHCR